jgi:hypothetical protein
MRCASRRPFAPVVALGACAALALAGCGQPVREDRTITWSPDGQRVGFQHGQEGVFVADNHAELATDVVAPLALKLHVPEPAGKQTGPVDLRVTLQELALACAVAPGLAPLFAAEFQALLPEEQCRSLFTRWGALRGRAADAPSRQAVDHALYAAAVRLGLEKEQNDIAARITADGGTIDADWWAEVSRTLATIRGDLGRRSPRR